MSEVRPILLRLCEDAVVVTHNAAFDLPFLPFLADRPLLCAMRLARRVVPDAPNYKNQVLRYHLRIDDLPPDTGAHRALDDVRVTSKILTLCLQRYLRDGYSDDVDRLVADIAAPLTLTTLPFGRYRGIPIDELPGDYLCTLACSAAGKSLDVSHTIALELRRRSDTIRKPYVGSHHL
jgi:DNA polymerase III epsilon subunit-like protein